MIVISEAEATVKVERVFEGLEAYEDGQKMLIFYKEITSINGEVLKTELKSYQSNFAYWKASTIGQEILRLINVELENI